MEPAALRVLDLPRESRSEDAMERRIGNLPVPATSLIGRHHLQRDIARALRTSRLVTLVGPGGIGKSRLAIAVGRSVCSDYPDGVWHVDLTTVPPGGAVDDAILTVLEREDRSSASSGTRVLDVVRGRSLLLILDNCEHVARQAALVSSQLLATSPALHILTTSRVALETIGEHVVPVDALAIPDPSTVSDAREAASFDAVRLLVARATDASPSFALDDTNYREIAAIGARLEGWPLAIELAASHLRSLTPTQLLDQFGDRLSLRSNDPATSPRHSSMRAVIAWSWELCNDAERILWQRAAVFAADGFDMDAAREVCADEVLPAGDMWRVLDSLVAKSILVVVRSRSAMRFRFLETVRQYGWEQLTIEDRSRFERAHRDYYVGLTDAALAAWGTGEQTMSISRGRLEKANIMKALEWSLSTPGEADSALRIAAGMRYHWAIDGSLREGRTTLTRALEASRPDAPDRPEALCALAWVTELQGDEQACAEALAAGASAALAADHQSTYAHLLALESAAQLWRGEISAAVSGLQSAQELAMTLQDVGTSVFASMLLVLALTEAGRWVEAEQVAAGAVKVSERSGEVWNRSQLIWALGYSRWVAGDPDAARGTIVSALELRLDFDQTGRALQLETLAWIAASQREYARAATLFGGVGQLWRRLGTSISAFGVQFASHSRACEQSLRNALPADRFDAQTTAGARLPLADLVEYAMGHELGETDTADRRLTRRENEVARLLGEGLSTVDIADRLVLSTRTVEGHVTRAASKLGLHSRTQLAVWAAKRASGLASGAMSAAPR
jgi:predicted ATPase/DNA-binding CsgD family transcriptional regulator